MADYKNGYSSTGAPLAVKDKIITGMAGGEFGVRGFIDAYDAKTGKRLWRFNTDPGQRRAGQRDLGRRELENRLGHDLGDRRLRSGEQYGLLGHRESGAGLERRRAQGRQPVLGLPDRAGSRHRREEVALPIHAARRERLGLDADADSGGRDRSQGQPRKMVVLANRNGFYYALDRTTGKFIAGRPYVKQTWASGLDEAGRPMRLPNAEPTRGGKADLAEPGGGSNWYSSTYSPKTEPLLRQREGDGGHLSSRARPSTRPGAFFNGGGQTRLQRTRSRTARCARWKWRPANCAGSTSCTRPRTAGLMTTARRPGVRVEQLVRSSRWTREKGALLWRFETGGGIDANPISYMSGGKQYVAIAAGHALLVFSLE